MLPYINRSASLYDDPASVQFHWKEQLNNSYKTINGCRNMRLEHLTRRFYNTQHHHEGFTTTWPQTQETKLHKHWMPRSASHHWMPNLSRTQRSWIQHTSKSRDTNKVPKMYIVTAFITLTATKATELHTLLARVLSAIKPYRAWKNHKTQSAKNQCKTISTEKRCRKYCFQGISAFTWGSDQTVLL